MSGEGRRQPASAQTTDDADVTVPPGSLGRFDLYGDWEAILTPHGWLTDGVAGPDQHWRLPRPDGKDYPGFTLVKGRGKPGDVLEVGSFAPPGLEDDDVYGKFHAFALLNYGGEDAVAFRAAALALRLLGYAEDDHTADAEARRVASCRQPDPQDVDTWAPVDLTPYIDGSVPPVEPSVGLARDDGLRMIYLGAEHGINGETESGKSWFCLACAAAELLAGNHVLYCHFEEAHPGDTTERLAALGVRAEVLAERFRFVAPDRPVTGDDLAALLDPAPSLVVLDGITEAMALHGLAVRDEAGAAAFRRLLVKPCTAVGAATLAADHVSKDVESRGRYALGSIHKANALTGALLLLENHEPFGRGARGRSRVSVVKDRPGHLRRHGQPGRGAKTYLGDLTVDAIDPAGLVLSFEAVSTTTGADGEQVDPDQARRDDADTHVIDVVTAITKRGDQASVTKVRSGSKISSDATADALDRLVADGRLTETVGPRNARIFSVTRPGVGNSHAAPESSRPDLTTRPLKGRGRQVGSNDRTSGRVRSGQVGSAPQGNDNGDDIDEINNRPSALTAGNQRMASSSLTASNDRGAVR